ncbi:MAG: gmd [Frankiales bacterium]|nr:gmd [Frankiales bacterium]
MRALVTGINGQDGLYLAELLSAKGYTVFGTVQPGNDAGAEEVRRIVPEAVVLEGDLADGRSLRAALDAAQPAEVYNLAAFTSVSRSWEQAELASDITATGVVRLLEAVRASDPSVRFFQASSSEIFGKVRETPQTETTPLYPRSPYGVAKAFAHHMTVNYRESYGLFACCGILFNHESERRPAEFVTRKITRGVARIALGLQDVLVLGNLDVRRDWGFAGDYVDAMWRTLQHDVADDYVIATGETHTVRELLAEAFAHVGIDDWHERVVQDSRFLRPAEVDLLMGDASKARDVLGWKPQLGFPALVQRMVDHDLRQQAETRP